MEVEELDPLLFSVDDLLPSSRHLLSGSTIDDSDFVCSESQGSSRCIHSHIPTTEHSDSLRTIQRCTCNVPLIGTHEIASGEVLVCAEYADEILPVYPEEFRQPRSGSKKEGIEALPLHEILQFGGTTDEEVMLYLHPHIDQCIELFLHDTFGQSEFGDTIDQDASSFVKCLEHDNLMSCTAEVCCGSHACRSTADDSYTFTGRCTDHRILATSGSRFPVCDIPLDTTDVHRLVDTLERLSYRTRKLTLRLLWTHSAAYGREHRALFDHCDRACEIALGSFGYETGNIDSYGAAGDAGCILALQTPQCLYLDLCLGVADGDLFHVPDAY